MKLNYFILIAIFALGAGYYFYSSSPYPQTQELSSLNAAANDDEAAPGEKEVDFEDMTPEQQAEYSKDDGTAEVKAAEAEYAIEQAPANADDGYVTTDQFTDDGGELMAQALAN